MSSRKISEKRLTKKQQTVCSLEIIEEGRVLKTPPRNLMPSKTTGGKISYYFTPFRSSWERNCSQTFKSTNSKTEENMRNHLKSLETDYQQLLEIARLEGLEQEKKLEQTKTDYEVMLESQNKSFKIREKELLEQIDHWKTMVDTVRQTFTEKETQKSIINTFEYEELSEKLESFERQNRLLQSSKENLESQNGVLINTLAQVIKSFTCLESKYKKVNFKNKYLQQIILNMHLTLNKHEHLSKAIDPPDNQSAKSHVTVECETEEFSNFLKRFKTRSDDDNRQENNSECNYMNLSDSEKINKNFIYTEPTEESRIVNINALISRSKLLLENNMENYKELHESTGSKDQEMYKIVEIFTAMNKERQHHKIENERLLRLNQEKCDIILEMENKQSESEKEKKNSSKQIISLKSFINTQTNKIRKLCELLSENTICLKEVDNNEELRISEQKFKQLENEDNCDRLRSNSEIEMEEGALEIERLMKNNTDIFNQSVIELKKIFAQLRQKNKNLKEIVSKTSVHMEALKKEYEYCKETCAKEIPKQFKTIEADIHAMREVYEHTIKLCRKESAEKISHIQELEELIEQMKNKIKIIEIIDEKVRDKLNGEDKTLANGELGKMFLNSKNKISNCQEESERSDEENSKASETNMKTKVTLEIERNKTEEKIIECRRTNRWKQHRTRDHDRRRKIDSCFETTESP